MVEYLGGGRIQGSSTASITSDLSLSELVAYYNFDETSGTTLTNQAGTVGSSDSLGTSVNGTNVGTATVDQTGKIVKCYDFDGAGSGSSNDHIEIPNALSTDLAGTNKVTYSLWFNTDEFSTTQGNGWDLIGTYGSGTGSNLAVYYGLGINYWYDGNIYVYPEYHGSFSGNSYGGISRTNLGASSTGTWYHLVVVFDGTATGNANRLKIYLNGTQKTFDSFNATIPSTISYGDKATWIGRPSYGSTYQKNFNGKIDEVSIWKRALSDGEISGLYNSGSGATPDNADVAVSTDEKDSITNVPSGTRFEETDTRKIYRYNSDVGLKVEMGNTDDGINMNHNGNTGWFQHVGSGSALIGVKVSKIGLQIIKQSGATGTGVAGVWDSTDNPDSSDLVGSAKHVFASLNISTINQAYVPDNTFGTGGDFDTNADGEYTLQEGDYIGFCILGASGQLNIKATYAGDVYDGTATQLASTDTSGNFTDQSPTDDLYLKLYATNGWLERGVAV